MNIYSYMCIYTYWKAIEEDIWHPSLISSSSYIPIQMHIHTYTHSDKHIHTWTHTQMYYTQRYWCCYKTIWPFPNIQAITSLQKPTWHCIKPRNFCIAKDGGKHAGLKFSLSLYIHEAPIGTSWPLWVWVISHRLILHIHQESCFLLVSSSHQGDNQDSSSLMLRCSVLPRLLPRHHGPLHCATTTICSPYWDCYYSMLALAKLGIWFHLCRG